MMTPPQLGTYYIEEPYLDDEVTRLGDLDRRVTSAMGGVLSEQDEPGRLRKVLDIACGVGHWAVDVALAFPGLNLIGIDLQPRMIAAARAEALALNLQQRVKFFSMDALQPLDFPDQSFDLINVRFALGFVRTWEWSRLVIELRRLLRPEGILQVTDEQILRDCQFPAINEFCQKLITVLHRSGHLFAPDSDGLTGHMSKLLTDQGFEQVREEAHDLIIKVGDPAGMAFIQDNLRLVRVLRPFMLRWGILPSEIDIAQANAQHELKQPDFAATWHLVTVRGTRSNTH